MIGSGLIVGGQLVPVPGVSVDNETTAPWCRLAGADSRTRTPGEWIRHCILHTTKGMWPQTIRPGAGPSDRDRRVADFWYRDPEHSAAHTCADSDGTGACYADLRDTCAYHATVSNRWSWGLEIYQEAGGVIYEAAIRAAARMALAGCRALGIQFQIPSEPYKGKPLERMADGGSDLVGLYGHRDNTTTRGRGDPGEAIWATLRAYGCEAFDVDAGEDVRVWRERQRWLECRGHKMKLDGIPGPRTTAALKAEGYIDGIWQLGQTGHVEGAPA